MAIRAVLLTALGAIFMSALNQIPAEPPPKRPATPAIRHREWIQIPLDAFFLAEMEPAGREPPAEAERAILIQRATTAILGRSATSAEIATFTESKTKRIYEKTLDRLLERAEFDARFAEVEKLIRKDDPASARDVVRGCWRLMTGARLENPSAVEWLAAELIDPTLVNCCELDRPLPEAWQLRPLVKAVAVSAMFRCLSSGNR